MGLQLDLTIHLQTLVSKANICRISKTRNLIGVYMSTLQMCASNFVRKSHWDVRSIDPRSYRNPLRPRVNHHLSQRHKLDVIKRGPMVQVGYLRRGFTEHLIKNILQSGAIIMHLQTYTSTICHKRGCFTFFVGVSITNCKTIIIYR